MLVERRFILVVGHVRESFGLESAVVDERLVGVVEAAVRVKRPDRERGAFGKIAVGIVVRVLILLGVGALGAGRGVLLPMRIQRERLAAARDLGVDGSGKIPFLAAVFGGEPTHEGVAVAGGSVGLERLRAGLDALTGDIAAAVGFKVDAHGVVAGVLFVGRALVAVRALVVVLLGYALLESGRKRGEDVVVDIFYRAVDLARAEQLFDGDGGGMAGLAERLCDLVLCKEHEQLTLGERTQHGVRRFLISHAVVRGVEIGVIVERDGEFRLADGGGLSVVGDGGDHLSGVPCFRLDKDPVAAGEHADGEGNYHDECEQYCDLSFHIRSVFRMMSNGIDYYTHSHARPQAFLAGARKIN